MVSPPAGESRLALNAGRRDNIAMAANADLKRSLSTVVDKLEAALRRMQLWEDESPSAARLASTQPFSVDTLNFHQWLQWQFIPRMRRILRGDGELPKMSAIRPYAEECVKELGGKSAELLFLIDHFDALIRGEAPERTH
jgi:uncharacterized protein YqcC (DUF446 family)